LDPTNPEHCAALLPKLARLYRHKPGRPPRWTAYESLLLLAEAAALREQHRHWSDTVVCNKLLSDHDRYRGLTAQSLRRRLVDARTIIKKLVDRIFANQVPGAAEAWRADLRRRGWGLKGSASLDQIMRDMIIAAMIDGARSKK
jgi:hypothetical protein